MNIPRLSKAMLIIGAGLVLCIACIQLPIMLGLLSLSDSAPGQSAYLMFLGIIGGTASLSLLAVLSIWKMMHGKNAYYAFFAISVLALIAFDIYIDTQPLGFSIPAFFINVARGDPIALFGYYFVILPATLSFILVTCSRSKWLLPIGIAVFLVCVYESRIYIDRIQARTVVPEYLQGGDR